MAKRPAFYIYNEHHLPSIPYGIHTALGDGLIGICSTEDFMGTVATYTMVTLTMPEASGPCKAVTDRAVLDILQIENHDREFLTGHPDFMIVMQEACRSARSMLEGELPSDRHRVTRPVYYND